MSIAVPEPKKRSKRRARPKVSDLLGGVTIWIDQRTGFVGPVRRFLTYPVPLYVHKNILYSLGGLSLISISLQVATGILLAFYYDPSPQSAYNSVDYVTFQLPLGWLIRGLHFYNSSAIVILISLHMLRTFTFGAYKKPREITWLSGVLLLLVTLGFAFTGYLLPWDQKGYWATKVGTEIAGTAPLIGDWQLRLIRGGPGLGQATLSRFYVTHIALLPAALALLIGLHIYQLRFHGVSPPLTERGRQLARRFVPFFPHWVVVDAILGVIVLGVLFYLSWKVRAPLDFPADPTSTDFLPRPEWYFLFLFQLLKYFPGPLEPVAAFVLPALVIGSMLILPFLDRSEERRPWNRPITMTIATVYIVGVVTLTLLAFRADRLAQEELRTAVAANPEAAAEAESQAEAEVVAIIEPEPETGTEPEITTGSDTEPEPRTEGISGDETNATPGLSEEVEAEVEPGPGVVSPLAGDPRPKPVPPNFVLAEALAAKAPLEQQPNTLTAIKVDEASLDAAAEYWVDAPRLEVGTQGAKAALTGTGQKTGPVVTMQAAYDARNIVIRAQWPDSTETLLKAAWYWNGSRSVKKGEEDRLMLVWPIGNNAEFSSRGCAAACHQAEEDDDWWMGSESERVRYDLWRWESARTNPVGQADDKWLANLTVPNDTKSSHHGDASTGGGYQENVAEDKRGPAFLNVTDLSSPLLFAGQAGPVDTSLLGDEAIVPGYILAPFEGSRGDIAAQGWWVEGHWVVVLQRALDTGYDDDARLIPGKRLPFGLALADNKAGISHTVAADVLILEWK
jgi:ubiquinol-cytochrome c reductase cytochrome b subunit